MPENAKVYGYGECSHCGWSVGSTKLGKAARHGFLRVKRGLVYENYPDIPSGTDGKPCPGSGKPLNNLVRFTKKKESK